MIDLTGKTCERMVPHSDTWGKWKQRCGKTAANTDDIGRVLCVGCSRKHNKKLQKTIDHNRKVLQEYAKPKK